MKLYEEDIIADSLSDEILGILGSMGSDDEKIAAILAAADKMFDRNSNSPSNDNNGNPEDGKDGADDDGEEKNTVYKNNDNDLGQGVEGEKKSSKQTSIVKGDDDIDLNKGNDSSDGNTEDNGDNGDNNSNPGTTHNTKGTGHDVGNLDKADTETPQPDKMNGEKGPQSQQTGQDQNTQPQNSPQSGMQQGAPRRSTQGQSQGMTGDMPSDGSDDFGETGDSTGQSDGKSSSRSNPRNNSNGQSNGMDNDMDYDSDDTDGGPEGDNTYGGRGSSKDPMGGQSSDGDGDDEWDDDFGGGQGQGSQSSDSDDEWDDDNFGGGQGQGDSQSGDDDEQDDFGDSSKGQNRNDTGDQTDTDDGTNQNGNQRNDSGNQDDKSDEDSNTQNKSNSQKNKKDSSTNPQQGQGSGSDDTQDQGQGQGQSKDQDDQQEQPENPDNFDNDIVSDYDKGSGFGEFLAGLIYTFGGNPATVMSKMHFDKVYELPDLPTMKVKNIHDIDFSDGTVEEPVEEALHESAAEDIDIINDLRSALQGTNNKKKLAKIMAILARRKNGNIEPEGEGPGEEPGEEPEGDVPNTPQEQTKGDIDWKKVKIAVADGDCDGTGKLFGGNHVMTDDLKQELEDARANKLKKTTYDKESPFSSEDGLLKTIEQVTGRMFGKDFQPDSEDPAAKNIQRIKERLRYNRKGFVNWINLLIKYLKGIKYNKEKTVFTTRTIVDPNAPARYYYDPVSEIGNKIVVYLDVSGSVIGRPGVLSQVIAELKKIAHDCKFRKIDIVCFAGNILDNYCLYEQTPSELKDPKWTINTPPGGSTVYSAIYNHMFKYYYKTAKKVSAMLIFSDQDALSSSNIFTNWGKKESNKKKAAFISQRFGNKCIFIGIDESPSQLPEFKAATIPGTKVILVSGSDFTTALENSLNNFEVQEGLNINNHNMIKNYFKVDNKLNEMAFIRRKGTKEDPGATPGAETPVSAPVPHENPESEKSEEPNEPMDMNTLLDRAEKKAVRRANREGSSRYEGNIDEWMNAVFGMWHIKKVAGTQAMIAEPQTYCVILDNDIFKVAINNELSPVGGKKAVGAAYAAQRITIPPKALTPNFMEMGENIQIISLRGNIKVANFMGEKFPPFFPKRLIANMNGQGGNLYISNCPNLSSTENWPISLEGKVIIEGRINISEDELDAYDEKVQAIEAKRRADMGLPPITNPDSKVEY